MMNPSPPNRPTPSLRWKAMPIETPLAAAMNRYDLAGVRRAEGQPLLLRAAIQEDRHEQRLARKEALAGAHQGSEKSALPLLRAVAEDRFHLDAVFHVHHPAGFGDGRLVGVELDFDKLQVLAKNLVVDLMHVGHRRMSFLTEGLRPSDSPTRSLARRFAGSLRSRGARRFARTHLSTIVRP
jgi:hypothetical protein